MHGLSTIAYMNGLEIARVNNAARREGNRAFWADVPLCDCPYTGAEARAHWEQGWQAGAHGCDYSGEH